MIACADEPANPYDAFATAGDAPDTYGDSAAEGNSSDPGDSGQNDDHSDSDDPPGQSSGDGDGEDDADADDDDAIKFDLGLADMAHAKQNPCGVDILFIIDNSGSMNQHKDDITDAFDNFIDEMVGALSPGTPVHIGVTRATGFFNPGNGSGWNDPSCHFGYIDGTWSPPTVQNNGINGQQGRLFENAGKRYFKYDIGGDPAELGQWFESTLADAITLDLASNTESVVAAAAYPFHPINAEHNAGFLREKAVLVLFLLSDAPDSAPPQIPTSIFINMVSDAKQGCGDGCILPTGIIQTACYDKPSNENTRLTDFMNGFGGPPAALDFFYMNEAPESFTSVFGATLAESIAYTCEYVVPVD